MDEVEKVHFWHALTPAGVARFASAPLIRLWLAQLSGGLIVAVSVVWFCAHNFSPVITKAVQQLSEDSAIAGGKLRNMPLGVLAESKFLSISASGIQKEEAGIGDVQLIFQESSWKISSVFGYVEFPYSGQTISLARSRVEPWWGAWHPIIFTSAGALTIVFLFLVWSQLAWIYCWLPKLLSFFMDRKLSWKESRRLCVAGQISGAMAATLCILLYGLTIFDQPRFLFFFTAHLIVDWIYIFCAPFFLPKIPVAAATGNPFSPANKPQT